MEVRWGSRWERGKMDLRGSDGDDAEIVGDGLEIDLGFM